MHELLASHMMSAQMNRDPLSHILLSYSRSLIGECSARRIFLLNLSLGSWSIGFFPHVLLAAFTTLIQSGLTHSILVTFGLFITTLCLCVQILLYLYLYYSVPLPLQVPHAELLRSASEQSECLSLEHICDKRNTHRKP